MSYYNQPEVYEVPVSRTCKNVDATWIPTALAHDLMRELRKLLPADSPIIAHYERNLKDRAVSFPCPWDGTTDGWLEISGAVDWYCPVCDLWHKDYP